MMGRDKVRSETLELAPRGGEVSGLLARDRGCSRQGQSDPARDEAGHGQDRLRRPHDAGRPILVVGDPNLGKHRQGSAARGGHRPGDAGAVEVVASRVASDEGGEEDTQAPRTEGGGRSGPGL